MKANIDALKQGLKDRVMCQEHLAMALDLQVTLGPMEQLGIMHRAYRSLRDWGQSHDQIASEVEKLLMKTKGSEQRLTVLMQLSKDMASWDKVYNLDNPKASKIDSTFFPKNSVLPEPASTIYFDENINKLPDFKTIYMNERAEGKSHEEITKTVLQIRDKMTIDLKLRINNELEHFAEWNAEFNQTHKAAGPGGPGGKK